MKRIEKLTSDEFRNETIDDVINLLIKLNSGQHRKINELIDSVNELIEKEKHG